MSPDGQGHSTGRVTRQAGSLDRQAGQQVGLGDLEVVEADLVVVEPVVELLDHLEELAGRRPAGANDLRFGDRVDGGFLVESTLALDRGFCFLGPLPLELVEGGSLRADVLSLCCFLNGAATGRRGTGGSEPSRRQTTRTLSASSPLRPGATSNSTC